MTNKVEGLHHIAISTGDIKAQIEFFTDKLGMELVALYWMHGAKDTWHGFLRMNDESSVAFVQHPKIKDIPAQLGVTHAGNPTAVSAGGTMQHIALKVAGHAELEAMRDRLRSKGVPVLGPVDHGFCKSIYFAGPENLSLEFSYSDEPIDAQSWIDPDVVARAGISAEELSRYMRPPGVSDLGVVVAQPGPNAPGPHMGNYPPGIYQKLMALPDKAVWDASYADPPVKKS